MARFDLVEKDKFPMLVVGPFDPEEFTEQAQAAGHPTEELRPLGRTAIVRLLVPDT